MNMNMYAQQQQQNDSTASGVRVLVKNTFLDFVGDEELAALQAQRNRANTYDATSKAKYSDKDSEELFRVTFPHGANPHGPGVNEPECEPIGGYPGFFGKPGSPPWLPAPRPSPYTNAYAPEQQAQQNSMSMPPHQAQHFYDPKTGQYYALVPTPYGGPPTMEGGSTGMQQHGGGGGGGMYGGPPPGGSFTQKAAAAPFPPHQHQQNNVVHAAGGHHGLQQGQRLPPSKPQKQQKQHALPRPAAAGPAAAAQPAMEAAADHHRQPPQLDPIQAMKRTTVMIRRIQDGCSREMLQKTLDDLGYEGVYDFLYLPMDFQNGVNIGYAFVNFVAPEIAHRFMEEWPRRRHHGGGGLGGGAAAGGEGGGEEAGEVSWSHPHQGLESHVERYRNSPVMHRSMPDSFKPKVFVRGQEVPFPPPTKVIRPPKVRPARRQAAPNGMEGNVLGGGAAGGGLVMPQQA